MELKYKFDRLIKDLGKNKKDIYSPVDFLVRFLLRNDEYQQIIKDCKEDENLNIRDDYFKFQDQMKHLLIDVLNLEEYSNLKKKYLNSLYEISTIELKDQKKLVLEIIEDLVK